jgi:hypothetical protein
MRVLTSFLLLACTSATGPAQYQSGLVIPDEGYSDQPYGEDGRRRLAVCHHGTGRRRPAGSTCYAAQHGPRQTWSDAVDVEPSTGRKLPTP